MKIETNHVYIGNIDYLQKWVGIVENIADDEVLSEDSLAKVINKVRELITILC